MRRLVMAFAMFTALAVSLATMETQGVGAPDNVVTVKVLGRGTGTGKVATLKDTYHDAVERAE